MPKRILVVDDQAINRALLRHTLEGEYEVLEAENGRAALDLLHKSHQRLSAVLLDIVMPEMTGYELLTVIRADARYAALPVLMVTGSEDEDSRVKALSLGANDFILKPFNPDIVLHCLKNNIALYETARTLDAIQRDKLTGLYHREAFLEKVAGLVVEHTPGHYILSCFDIDNFKLINDQYGAAEGDRILREIGRAVGKSADRLDGIAARISADNFAALFPACHKEMVMLRQILGDDFVSAGRQAVMFSIGRYHVTDVTLPASALYDRAFIAKQSVKGRYDQHLAYFDDRMLEKLVRDQQITGEMETALRAQEFEAWFQPQYNHGTGALVGAEALARWRHPQKGIIPPGEFIPLFEQNGFIYELDKYIWRDVCRRLRGWLDAGLTPLPVSVNISRYDVFRADLLDVLKGLIAEFRLPVELLRLEITESAFTSSSTHIVTIVKELIALGFTIEIDDFGSGFSSLNTLKNVPAQIVKLDMRFLDGQGDDAQRGGNILESIVRMTKWLGMTVLAEGVELRSQADFLKSIGCTYVQGYLYARPMPAEEYEQLLVHIDAGQHPFVSGADPLPLMDAFWDPKSVESLVFNRYSGGACVYEFCNGRIELIRVTDGYIHSVFGEGMSAEDALRIDWSAHTDRGTETNLTEAVEESVRTGKEIVGEYLFYDLPGCPHETWLRSKLRVIAGTDDRSLVYCSSVNITAQREAQKRNEAAADQLQAVLDNVNCGITAVTMEGERVDYILLNDRYCTMLGYTKEDYRQVEAFSPIHPDDRARITALSRRAYQTGEPATAEYRAVRQDGRTIWMRVSLSSTHIAGIDRPVLLGFFSDISEERRAQEELLDNLPGGAALYELDGNRFCGVHYNKRYRELVECDPTDERGLSIHTAIHPEDAPIALREIRAALSQGRDISCDVRIRHGQSDYRPFHVDGRVVPKGNGRTSINAIFTPITDERMSLQEMLPVALQATMDNATELSFVKDIDLRFICCSRRFVEYAGCQSEKEMLGKTSFDIFAPELSEEYVRADRSVLESGQSLVEFDTLLPTANGPRHLVFSKSPLLGANGRILGVYAIGRDVTELRRNESRLEMLTNNIPGGLAVYEGLVTEPDKINLTYFSDGFCRLFGYTRAEYEQRAKENPLSLIYPEDIVKLRAQVRALVRENTPIDFVYRANVRGGTAKWINARATLSEHVGDRVVVNAVALDVTEQRDAIERLRMSEEISRTAIRLSRDIVCQYDIASKRLTVAPEANETFGDITIEEDVPDRLVREGRISRGTAAAYEDFYARIRRGDKTGETLYQRQAKDGWRWMKAYFSTIFSDGGDPVTSVISCEDVTESIERDAAYKKWRQSLRERRPESYALFQCNVTAGLLLNTHEGSLMLDEKENQTDNLAERTAEYTEKWVSEEDRARIREILNKESMLRRFAQGQAVDSFEYREVTPDGGIRWRRLTVDLIESSFSADTDAYLLFEDIDEQKRTELELLERAESDPLTGVLNRAAFAKSVNERIAASGAGACHALLMMDIDGFKLVNDIFGHGAGDQVLIDLADLLRRESRKEDLVGRLGGDEFVVFLSDLPGEGAAAKKAQQLCELTRKALSDEVQISASVGIALSPRDGASFEELYSRADRTLYYVKGAGKDNFAFYHDEMASDGAARAAAAKPSTPVLPGGRKRRMLIVDDSRIDHELLSNLFKDEFRIDKATDGASALMKLRHYGSAVSVVLLDLLMPGVDGFSVLEQMRQSADLSAVPVVVVSGADDRAFSLRAIRAGAADYVTKPVDPDVLRIRVHSAVSKAENERLRAQNSFLEMQSSELSGYRAALERMGTAIILYDWVKSRFTYGTGIGRLLRGNYDGRSFWRILLSDMVTDAMTVQRMQNLTHDVANDHSRTDGSLVVRLRAPSGKLQSYVMNVYKQVDDYGLADKLILAFREAAEQPCIPE